MDENLKPSVAGPERLDLWNLFETTPHAVAAIDERLEVIAANGLLRELLAELEPDAQTKDKKLTSLFPNMGRQLELACKNLLESGEQKFSVQTIKDKNGNLIEFRFVAVEPGRDDLRLLLMIPPGQGRMLDGSADEREESQLKKLAENLADVLFTTDSQGRIVYISPQVEQYGYSPRDMVFHEIFEFIHPDDRESVKRRFFETTQGKQGGPVQFRLMIDDGSFEWIEARSNTHLDSQKQIQSLNGVLRNISERMELETARARSSRLESLELLAGGIAHDFNNLLTSILGGISLARSLEKKTGQASEILANAEKAVVMAEDLTHQLLSFAKGSAPVRQLTDTSTLIRDSVNLNMLGSNVRSALELATELWPVNVDQGQIAQVLSNLVINAKQAMPSGGTLIVRAGNCNLTVDEVHQLEPGRYVRVDVSDNGEGISPENMDKVFDPYFTTKSHGTGLGLATVFSIVRRHCGVVTVHSEPGKGSVFSVYLPAAECAGAKPEHAARESAPVAGRRGRILVMDDEEEVSSICGKILERIGHQVICCPDGEAALALYADAMADGNPYDIVILDLTVPGGMGGVETIKRLKELDPKVLAVVSSGYSNDPVMADPAGYGFSAVVPKPYKFDQMQSTVNRLIEKGR